MNSGNRVSSFPRDVGLFIFPVMEVTVVLLSLDNPSQGGLRIGLEKGWARAEPLQTL